MLELLWTACQRPLDFTEREQAREFFTRLGVSFRALNSSVWDSPDYRQHREQVVRQLEHPAGTPSPASAVAG